MLLPEWSWNHQVKEHAPLQGASVQRQTGHPEASHPLNPRSSTMMFLIPESSSLVSERYFENMRAHDGPRTWSVMTEKLARKTEELR
jgi:hypothetical protein